jgi:hypothetical protein
MSTLIAIEIESGHGDKTAAAITFTANQIALGFGAGLLHVGEADKDDDWEGSDCVGFWSLYEAQPSPGSVVVNIHLDAENLSEYEIAAAASMVADAYGKSKTGDVLVFGNAVGTWTTDTF